jgi:hypothetical protein
VKVAFVIDNLDTFSGQFDLELAAAIVRFYHKEAVDFVVLSNSKTVSKNSEDFSLIIYNQAPDRSAAICSVVEKYRFERVYFFNVHDALMSRALSWSQSPEFRSILVVKSENELGGYFNQLGYDLGARSRAKSAILQVDLVFVPNDGLAQYIKSQFPEVASNKVIRFQLLKQKISKHVIREKRSHLDVCVPLIDPDITALDFLNDFIDDLLRRSWLFSNQGITELKLSLLLKTDRQTRYLEKLLQKLRIEHHFLRFAVSQFTSEEQFAEAVLLQDGYQILLQDSWLNSRIALNSCKNQFPFLADESISLCSFIDAKVRNDFAFGGHVELTEKLSRISRRNEIAPTISPSPDRIDEDTILVNKSGLNRVVTYIIFNPKSRTELQITLSSLREKKAPVESIYVLLDENVSSSKIKVKSLIRDFGLKLEQFITSIRQSSQDPKSNEVFVFIPSGSIWLKDHKASAKFLSFLEPKELHIFASGFGNQLLDHRYSECQVLLSLDGKARFAYAVQNDPDLGNLIMRSGRPGFASAFFRGYFLTTSNTQVVEIATSEDDPVSETMEIYQDFSNVDSVGGAMVRNLLLAQYQYLRAKK